MIERKITTSAIRTALKRSRGVVLPGPRQCGKTTLARRSVPFDSINYFVAMTDPDEAFFRATHAGAELDLLLLKGNKRIGIEIKRSDAPVLTPSMFSSQARGWWMVSSAGGGGTKCRRWKV